MLGSCGVGVMVRVPDGGGGELTMPRTGEKMGRRGGADDPP